MTYFHEYFYITYLRLGLCWFSLIYFPNCKVIAVFDCSAYPSTYSYMIKSLKCARQHFFYSLFYLSLDLMSYDEADITFLFGFSLTEFDESVLVMKAFPLRVKWRFYCPVSYIVFFFSLHRNQHTNDYLKPYLACWPKSLYDNKLHF